MIPLNRLPILIAVATAAACGRPAAEPPDTVPGGAPDAGAFEGVVRVVGSAPVDVHVVVRAEDGSDVRVVGPLRDEIRRLSGAVVRVDGAVEGSGVPVAAREVRATDYEIVSVNGEPVIQGVIEGKTGGWTVLRTRSGERVYLGSAPESMRTGQTVWVQGPRSVVVQSFGVIRD